MTGWKACATDYIAQTGVGRQIRQEELPAAGLIEPLDELVAQVNAEIHNSDIICSLDSAKFC
jgi:hypothetical protein